MDMSMKRWHQTLIKQGVCYLSDNLMYYICILLAVCLMCWQQPVQGFFMDDLTLMRDWQEKESIASFIFSFGDTHLRPVSNFFLGIGLGIAGANTDHLWIWTVFMGFLTAVIIFHVFNALTSNKRLAFWGTIIFVFSRFGYYAYAQYFGIMELTGTMMAVMVLYHTQCMPASEKPEKHLTMALLFSVLSILSHERYLSLMVLVIIAALIANATWRKRVWMTSVALGCLIAMLVARFFLLGADAFRGTSGMNITDTFDLNQSFLFLVQAVLYLFGLNTGENYLAGYNYAELTVYVLGALVIFWLCILLLIWSVCRNKRLLANWKQYFLAVAFVGGTLITSCITFRLELRWLYTSYVGFILILIKLVSDCAHSSFLKSKIVPAILLACLIFVELFYHGGYPYIYFWHPQNAYNQIYNELIDVNDHESLDGKRIGIVCDYANGASHIETWELKAFFDAYARERQFVTPEVTVYNSMYEIDISNPPDVIISINWVKNWLQDEPEVKNITQEFYDICEISRPVGNTIREAAQFIGFSWWEGWEREFIWTEKTASMRIATGQTGIAKLTGKMKSYNIPNNLYVYFNDELIQTFPLNSEEVDISFVLPANSEGILRLELDSAVSPYDIGEADDRRMLGICIYDLIVE